MCVKLGGGVRTPGTRLVKPNPTSVTSITRITLPRSIVLESPR
jgi:hypothetical protein